MARRVISCGSRLVKPQRWRTAWFSAALDDIHT